MVYSAEKICSCISGQFLSKTTSAEAEYIVFDSRKTFFPARSVFFALVGERRDGHSFIGELYRKGVRCFVVSKPVQVEALPDAVVIKVEDTLSALQQLAGQHRRQFPIPVIGITGSNGKTIVKEWLFQLLHNEYKIARSPRSYNSQVGVPLSVWQLNTEHTLGIFEAGISRPGEMVNLQKIIQPTIGVLTTIGEAHSEGFASREQKLREKADLFVQAEVVIYPADDSLVDTFMKHHFRKTFSWGRRAGADLEVISVNKRGFETELQLKCGNETTGLLLPFTDDASVENAVICFCVLKYLQVPSGKIAAGIRQLTPVNMRLELKKGINQCTVINDSYSADLDSFHIALNFLEWQGAGLKKTVILSDFLQSGLTEKELYGKIKEELVRHSVHRVIGIGKNISRYLEETDAIQKENFLSTEDFLKAFRFSSYQEEAILVKGARSFAFEQIVQLLELKSHQTVLEINLDAIAHNFKEYQKFLAASVKTMAMVKAFAYGSGGAEIAGVLQFHHCDYLAVAYADEGVELRKAGIHLPLMVMNTDRAAFDSLVTYNLEPVLFSESLLRELDVFLKNEGIKDYPVHLEIETGMNRLGFSQGSIPALSHLLKNTDSFRVQSVFSHLAASEEKEKDDFTRQQAKLFLEVCSRIETLLGYPFLRHIANTAAVTRHPDLQLDMVRLGIGLYGVDTVHEKNLELKQVAVLKSTIAQIHHVQAGESVSYNRKAVMERNSVIATVRIGYADGYSRKFSNGNGYMLIKGQAAPVVGTVCMDMTMVDVTGIRDVQEGDEVIVFGNELPVESLSEWAGTIPYEIMTGISQRVKRVYYGE